MYSVLRSESPQARSCGLLRRRTLGGVISPTQSHTRFQTLCAAFTEICWPQIARASVMKASPRRTMNTFGWRLMIAAMTGSFRQSARFALSQYSGFIERQVQDQILRLHLHHVALAGRQRKVH